ncbi:UDP-N-acetylmuramoyl-tripeptide--D-alanyl-D-alanine ligase [Synechococcus sp. CS-1331]|uniref:UDP-N-acetylmuramoyl-tripeptide--D-alanyl-D- alanine ligase n=1 Tax=Synechococcus sp. CS-1331 TaxID=2847973 RepID=UPI00223B8AD9|nr:UDP-N-acetylmuramoyl-tripeptide--D-alanyl-D-alanine ligase [Synechococcus sp. CS-1331]MCT0226821.1 UDP-N-acetylmuramoyl-tripeptide--D-alanyl-D-alanine ligase [Synechococcus sp. CS-1331]
MALHLGQLQQLWGPPVTGPLTPAQASIGLEPQAICTDSRQLAAGQLFVPLVGERFDGHVFLPAALEAGAVALLAQAEQLPPAALGALAGSVPLWLVPDTLLAYQQLACLWRRQLSAGVVAVTGSAGKTTTRELIRAALAPLGEVGASSGNENNDVGVPLTLLKATPAQAAVVVEMGMRGLGEIERLSRCACPDVAVITNIGTAHIGRLGSREAIATAKCEITAGLRPDGVVVIPAGDPLLDGALARVWAGRVVRIALAGEGHEAQADLVGQLDGAGGILKLAGEELAGVEVAMPLEGVHHARNLLLALAVARELGLEPARWQPLEVALPGGRSRRLELGGVRLLDETYNASPEAVLASLDLLARQPGRRFAVLGTMLELGDQSLALHREVAARALSLGLDGLVVVDGGPEGEAMLAAAQGLARLERVDTPAAAAEPLGQWLEPGDVLLLKASRGVALEQLIPLLQLA